MKYDISQVDLERDANNFKYHPPTAEQTERYRTIRQSGLGLVTLLRISCPPSRELSLAITKIEEAVYWGNAAIARNEKSDNLDMTIDLTAKPINDK